MYNLFSLILDWIMKTFFLDKISNLENLEVTEPSIIVANHSSYLDHFALLYAFRKANNNEKLYFLAKSELFDKWLSRKWQTTMNAIPIDRDGDNAGTLNQMKSILKEEKKSIVIYPEGTRTYNGKVHIGKQGALVLAQVTKAPVVPVGIEGAFDVLPRKTLVPHKEKINLNIGKKFFVKVTKANRGLLQQKMMQNLTRLSKGVFELEADDIHQSMLDTVKEYNELGIRDYPYSNVSSTEYHRRALYITKQLLKTGFKKNEVLVEQARAIGKLGMKHNRLWALMRLRHAKYLVEQTKKYDDEYYMADYVLATCYNWLPKSWGGSKIKAQKLYLSAIKKEPTKIFTRLSYSKFLQKNKQYSASLEQAKYILKLKPEDLVDKRRKIEALEVIMRMNKSYDPEEEGLING